MKGSDPELLGWLGHRFLAQEAQGKRESKTQQGLVDLELLLPVVYLLIRLLIDPEPGRSNLQLVDAFLDRFQPEFDGEAASVTWWTMGGPGDVQKS